MTIFKDKNKYSILEEYVTLNQEKLYRLAYIYVKNQEDAMDILQESILKAYRNLEKLNEIKTLERWMNKIIINTSLDFIRKNSKITLTNDEELKNIEEVTDGHEDVTNSVDNLDTELKTVIILKYFHGYTINEIGEILGLPISTVKNRIHKSLNILRKEFKGV
ncbi:RNA polymerase sigma factor [Clostridium paraputrificum]|uniref:RNA polymerase sigma factor n=1 Tax=Clostridium TaxID=1485 RepID=UPI003D33E00E